MGIIQELKMLLGYSGNDLDIILGIFGLFIIVMFFTTFFSILSFMFGGRKWRR